MVGSVTVYWRQSLSFSPVQDSSLGALADQLNSPSNTLVGPLLLAPEHNMNEGNILPALEENAELLKHSACYEVGCRTASRKHSPPARILSIPGVELGPPDGGTCLQPQTLEPASLAISAQLALELTRDGGPGGVADCCVDQRFCALSV
ncbi:hypothetical protein MUG91_G355n5 [Manis pentadactyla]|nr:hypothetical protein MUG91_G355n5 [Manis pentadactyla]